MGTSLDRSGPWGHRARSRQVEARPTERCWLYGRHPGGSCADGRPWLSPQGGSPGNLLRVPRPPHLCAGSRGSSRALGGPGLPVCCVLGGVSAMDREPSVPDLPSLSLLTGTQDSSASAPSGCVPSLEPAGRRLTDLRPWSQGPVPGSLTSAGLMSTPSTGAPQPPSWKALSSYPTRPQCPGQRAGASQQDLPRGPGLAPPRPGPVPSPNQGQLERAVGGSLLLHDSGKGAPVTLGHAQ